MHKWLISVCFFLINLNFASPTTVKTLSVSFDLNLFHPPDALGCSCVQSDNQIVKKFNFEQYSSCGFQSGDPWPYCITTDEGDCPFKRQTSIPNVFYIPCERHHVLMNPNCTGKTCQPCANFDVSGKRQIISRTYDSPDYEACDSKCLKSDLCTFTSFSGSPPDFECALFSHCTTRARSGPPTEFLRHRITVKTNYQEANVPDPTPLSFRQDDRDGLNDCLCRNRWPLKDTDWGPSDCLSQTGCADEKCLGGNWCPVANPPCKNQFTQDKIAWIKCSNETQIEPSHGCKCKARWGLPDVLGPECVNQRGCSYSEKCTAHTGFGLCEFEREGCTLKGNVMPCSEGTPVATLPPEDKQAECRCKENWENIALDSKCVNQHGCATSDCAGGNWTEALNVPTEDFPTAENSEYITLWCIVENKGCRTQVPGTEISPCITKEPKKTDQDNCRSSEPENISFELRYDTNGNTLSTTAVVWKNEQIMQSSISFQNLGKGGMVLFSTDASEGRFTTKNKIFNPQHSYIRCPDKQECKGPYSVNIQSEMGFQIIYLRFISTEKLTGGPESKSKYNVQSEKIVKCKSTSSNPGQVNLDLFPHSQNYYLNPFYITRAPVSSPSFQGPHHHTGDIDDLLDWKYLWQVSLIVLLALVIFLLFLGIHNLDTCCDSLAEHMFEASSGDSMLAPGEYQSQQFTEELLLGHHETGEDPICLSGLSQPGNWDEFENPEQVNVQMEDENEI